MATKMKGIYKGFKFISQIFVVKEREMEIGHPTDVKHLAHIGWDGPSATPPSWMNEFKTAPEFATAFGNPRGHDSSALSNWSSQDIYRSVERQQATEMVRDVVATDISDVFKKQRNKKKSFSSPKSSCRPSRSASKSKTSFHFQL